LLKCSSASLSDESIAKVSTYLRVVAELEDICDCGDRLVTLAARKTRKNHQLPESTRSEIENYSQLLYRFTEFWQSCLQRGSVKTADLETGFDLESQIDQARKRLRKESMQRMAAGGDSIKAEVLYIDILNNMERIGNHSLNILQALRHTR
jgi:phosphate:Na+ symporter